ncbi:MAG: hypothetical protein RSA90_00280 [Lachnospiraceae bacterium]
MKNLGKIDRNPQRRGSWNRKRVYSKHRRTGMRAWIWILAAIGIAIVLVVIVAIFFL